MTLRVSTFVAFFLFMNLLISQELTPDQKNQSPLDAPHLGFITGNETDQIDIKAQPERELKDSANESSQTFDFQEAITPFDESSDMSRPRSLLGDGNPIWKKEFHKTSKNYFQLFFPNFNIRVNRLNQVKVLINKWMEINPDKESLTVTPLRIRKQNSRNRYSVVYKNISEDISKKYCLFLTSKVAGRVPPSTIHHHPPSAI